MAGARSLWRANGMREDQIGKPVIAVVNSFTQFVPGHVHLHAIGQQVKKMIEAQGCFAAEFNTIAIDDGIAMGHEGMLYSLPSRELIADSVEYMVNAHMADAMICISNCDKITPGMLMAAMRLNIPSIFVSGGPMEAGVVGPKRYDLIDAMVMAADPAIPDKDIAELEVAACPTCGSCSGMFTANSMNCLAEALGMALPGNGTLLATHKNRMSLFEKASERIVEMAIARYERDDQSVLPDRLLPVKPSSTPCLLTSQWADPPILFCTCWLSRRKRMWISQCRILTGCREKYLFSAKLRQVALTTWRMSTGQAASWPSWENWRGPI